MSIKKLILKGILALCPLVVVLFSLNSCANKKQNTSNTTKKYTPEQITKSYRISGLSFSKDGSKILYTSDETGFPSAWMHDINTNKKHLIHQDSIDPVYSNSFLSNNEGLVFTSTRNGSQYIHLFIKNRDNIIDITPGENIRARFRGVNNDFSGFYYTTNNRSPRKFDLYEYNFEEKSSEMVFQNDTKYSLGMISRNHNFILLHERKTEEITNLHLFNIENKKPINISPEDNGSLFYGIDFSLNGEEIYYLTNYENEYTFLEKYNIKTSKRTSVAKEHWDIVGATFSPDHKFVAIYINDNGTAKLKIKNLALNKFLNIPFLEQNIVEKVKFSPDNKYLSMQVVGYNQPKDMWLLDLNTMESRQIFTSLNPEIDKSDLSIPIDTMITSFDGLKIPAFLYLPKANRNKKRAALIWTHGGPGGQFRTNYNQYIQFVVNQGYTVLAINNRGSSGYGKTFKALDNQKHGIDDLKDILEGKEFLTTLEGVDENKIGIIGDSYGGYLVLAALTFHPDEFAIGIDMFGISNWLHVLNNIPGFWEARKTALYEEMGNPKTDSIMLYNKSPLFFSEHIKSPLMVIQGANDPKVLQSQSDSIVARVRANNVPTKYILFADEGHGIRKKENQIKTLKEIAAFLSLYLN